MVAAKFLILSALLGLFTTAGLVMYHDSNSHHDPQGSLHHHSQYPDGWRKPHGAPELDSAVAAEGFALIGGCVLAIRARRKK